MTREEFETLFDFWAEVLHLGHWDWRFEYVDSIDDEDDEEPMAAITPSIYYEWAEVKVTHAVLLTMDPYEVDVTIVHELFHAFCRDLDRAMSGVEDFLSDEILDMHLDRVNFELEGVTDSIARIIVKLVRSPR